MMRTVKEGEILPWAYTVKIVATEMLNHNVKRFTTEKPPGLNYTPGQAVLVEISGMKGEKRPFTFTGLLSEPHLEFTIKLYHDHNGVTHHLTDYKPGDTLTFGDPWAPSNIEGRGFLWRVAQASHLFWQFCEIFTRAAKWTTMRFGSTRRIRHLS
jgi:NAD(P)H-flavin reductase